jgi:hypothetical protein
MNSETECTPNEQAAPAQPVKYGPGRPRKGEIRPTKPEKPKRVPKPKKKKKRRKKRRKKKTARRNSVTPKLYAKPLCAYCGLRNRYRKDTARCKVCHRDYIYNRRVNSGGFAAENRARREYKKSWVARRKYAIQTLAEAGLALSAKPVKCEACAQLAHTELSTIGAWLCRVCKLDFEARGAKLRRPGTPRKPLEIAEKKPVGRPQKKAPSR